MAWTMDKNGVCPVSVHHKFTTCACGWSGLMAAIDEDGKMFTWGYQIWGTGHIGDKVAGEDKYHPHDATDKTVANNPRMLKPYQVGSAENWVKVAVIERGFAALDTNGHLWAWGTWWYKCGGWDSSTKYKWTSGTLLFEPGGDIGLIPTLVNSVVWSDVAAGWYHMLGLKSDGTVWVWGGNFDDTYGMPAYGAGYESATPIQVTGLPASPVKLISAHYSVSAVITESNEVWCWGNFSVYDTNIPTQIALSVPSGVAITKVMCCEGSGIAVLLSNGDCYCRGKYIVQVTGHPYTSEPFVKVSGDHHFVDIFLRDEGIAGLDSSGNLWSWYSGNGSYIHSRDDGYCNEHGIKDPPELIAASTERQYNWKVFSLGGICHLVINSDGELFSWGSNYYDTLGYNLLYADFVKSCPPQQTYVATYYDGVEATTLAGATTGESAYRQPEVAGDEHEPCGHWHISRYEIEWPSNCWMPTLAIEGKDVLYVASGIYFPGDLMFVYYNGNMNSWDLLWHITGYMTHMWKAGAAIDMDGAGNSIYVFHAYSAIVSGRRTDEQYSHQKMTTWTLYNGTMTQTSWASTLEAHGSGNVAATAGGLVVVVVEDAVNFRVEVSVDGGVTFANKMNLAYTTDRVDSAVGIDHNGFIFVLTLNKTAGTLVVQKSVDNGASWATQGTLNVVVLPLEMQLVMEDADLFVSVRNSSEAKVYFSDDEGVSWSTDLLNTDSVYIAASGTGVYNLDTGVDYWTADFTATSIDWVEVPTELEVGGYTFSTSLLDCPSLRNAGVYTVYSNYSFYVELKGQKQLVMLWSEDLGISWRVVQTPIKYYQSSDAAVTGSCDPVWEFQRQPDKW